MTKRYWYHPESDSLWITHGADEPGTDGLVEEVSEAEFRELYAKRMAAEGAVLVAKEDAFGTSPRSAEQPQE